MDSFIQITVFCPPEPRVGAFVHWNAGKVYFLFFIVKKSKLNLEHYVALSHLKPCQTLQTNDLSATLYSAGYEFCRAAALHRPASIEKFSTIHAAKSPINKKNLFISKVNKALVHGG